jgi:hypothetical protein
MEVRGGDEKRDAVGQPGPAELEKRLGQCFNDY